ncbi:MULTISPECIES: hypothetical protein [unclassified Paenibacillus]|uniref:hypothetical protein n=1 Tax=unclassified Paenibacillus TaxID=185978 RepID=UPI001045E300|nr:MULTISPECIES: hypothetical protein [unclassified Paenibacillus]NIK71877.1 hypothetical protein [Paenibacillus sp. BK720]TCM96527.1 hypothetical protein EV294_105394 [Paenibacillus sp. BK033]
MSIQRIIIIVPLVCFLILSSRSYANADPNPKLDALEKAMLQELNPVIKSSLQQIYNERYPQFNGERIISINEHFTIKKNGSRTLPVDAIHGAQYFEIEVELSRPDGERIQLLLKNDGPDNSYALKAYKIIAAP